MKVYLYSFIFVDKLKYMNNPTITDLIKEHISPEVMEKHNLTVEKIIQDTKGTISGFGIKDKTEEEIFLQEVPYYIEFGMTAFDCGYLGKTLAKK